MTHEDAWEAGNVVEGKLPVSYHEARVWFDPGSTHSYIAPHFTVIIKRRLEQIQFVLIVTTRVGKKVVCELYFLKCRV